MNYYRHGPRECTLPANPPSAATGHAVKLESCTPRQRSHATREKLPETRGQCYNYLPSTDFSWCLSNGWDHDRVQEADRLRTEPEHEDGSRQLAGGLASRCEGAKDQVDQEVQDVQQIIDVMYDELPSMPNRESFEKDPCPFIQSMHCMGDKGDGQLTRYAVFCTASDQLLVIGTGSSVVYDSERTRSHLVTAHRGPGWCPFNEERHHQQTRCIGKRTMVHGGHDQWRQ